MIQIIALGNKQIFNSHTESNISPELAKIVSSTLLLWWI